ncbi:MAG: NapC/NirT family cytochrome c, partial [Nitrospiraceae bacterium]|nr:NapC/NirT family cytochrome c [Nitrospiraceae bacterium]
MEQEKLPPLFHNWMSIAGGLVALTSLLAIFFLFVITLIKRTTAPYIGVILYLVLPFFLVLGLLIIPAGMYVRWRKEKKGKRLYHKWPKIDLNVKQERNAMLVFILGTAVFALTSSVGVYKTYQFMETVTFCGLTCHKVMDPEYTAFRHSPHARLKCVQCHIGPGAGWYAKSKLSGLYQVYATIANVYPRPIPTPIEHLRPVQADCERCHWPKEFVGSKQKRFDHFLYDKSNTHWVIDMLLKIGGTSPLTAQQAGIHWHMNTAVKVEYIARDKQRQDIPWVRITDMKTGRVTVYRDVNNPLPGKEVLAARPRVMDCIDCHNSPSHNFLSPDHEIDAALAAGMIDRSIPEIKKVAVNAMVKKYRSKADAVRGIAAGITDFYRDRYPRFFDNRRLLIKNAVGATRRAYLNNIFPYMKVRWTVYPDNVGHFISRGCMRCHDGNHKSHDGRIIPNRCDTCHVIILQGKDSSFDKVQRIDLKRGLEFRHPVDIARAWKTGACYDCHT